MLVGHHASTVHFDICKHHSEWAQVVLKNQLIAFFIDKFQSILRSKDTESIAPVDNSMPSFSCPIKIKSYFFHFALNYLCVTIPMKDALLGSIQN